MRRPRRNHAAAFKAKVAVAALKGDMTLAELAEKFDTHANQSAQWRAQLMDMWAYHYGTPIDFSPPTSGYLRWPRRSPTVTPSGLMLATNRALSKSLPFDTPKDFTPLGFIGRVPYVLVVHPDVNH